MVPSYENPLMVKAKTKTVHGVDAVAELARLHTVVYHHV